MNDWRQISLGELGTVVTGRTPPSAQKQFFSGSIPFLTPTDIDGENRLVIPTRFVSDDWNKQQQRIGLPRSAICVVCIGATIGKVCMVATTSQSNQQINSIIVNEARFDPHFVYYRVRALRHELKARAAGAATPILNKTAFSEISIDVPPLLVQRRIGSILGAYDDLVEINRRRIALVEEMARRLFEEWFVRFRFPGREGALIDLHEGPLPGGWQWCPLVEVCEQPNGIQTGPFGSQLHQSDYLTEGVPVVMPKNLVNFRVDNSEIARILEAKANELGRHRMRCGDVVYGRRGDIGRRAYISSREEGWFCGTGCLRLRPDLTRVRPRYFFDTLGHKTTLSAIQGRAQGATMPNLSAGVMANVPVMVPPLPLQRQYDGLTEPIAELVGSIEAANVKLASCRDLLLPRLISGELSVSAVERELETAA
jgi:type I restriction enzyme S subunit